MTISDTGIKAAIDALTPHEQADGRQIEIGRTGFVLEKRDGGGQRQEQAPAQGGTGPTDEIPFAPVGDVG